MNHICNMIKKKEDNFGYITGMTINGDNCKIIHLGILCECSQVRIMGGFLISLVTFD